MHIPYNEAFVTIISEASSMLSTTSLPFTTKIAICLLISIILIIDFIVIPFSFKYFLIA